MRIENLLCKKLIPVKHILLRIYPKSSQLGKYADDLVGLEVVDEDVWYPEVVD